jgi:uncharacterized RDD family membrane protein YckC
MKGASLFPRGLARAIDFVVQVAILELAAAFSRVLPSGALLTLSDDALMWADLTVGLVALLAYTAIAERVGGATLGKHCVGLRVVSADPEGAPLSVRAAILRNLALAIDLLFFGLVAHSSMSRSPKRQRVGDNWAGTLVVWRQDAPDLQAVRGWPIGLVVALTLVCVSYVVAA